MRSPRKLTEEERARVRVCMARHTFQEKKEDGQIYCETCMRVQWPEELCDLADTGGEDELDGQD